MKNPHIKNMTQYGFEVWKMLPKDKKTFFKPLAKITGWNGEKQSAYIVGLLTGWELFDISPEQGADLFFRLMDNIQEDSQNETISKK